MQTWISVEQRQALLELIVTQGIHYATQETKIVARDGESELAWVMNFLGVSLYDQGLRLAALQMLELLESFEGKQLATIGTAAVPLLSACILLSEGKYTGLMVRPKRKAYGTAKLIDGVIDYNEPVIVIDDSIGSGTNMLDCIQKLEEEGLQVEGGACIVRFGYNSGYARMQEQGYQVAAAFDLYKDLTPLMPSEKVYPSHPVKARLEQIPWAQQVLPEGCSPFQVIRQVVQHYLHNKAVLRPPKTLNHAMETPGGIWISLRSQEGLFTRYARQGFWHLMGERSISTADDTVKAAYLVACELAPHSNALELLEQSGLAISAMGRLQACDIGDIDQTRDAIVMRSLETPWTMGGGLPNMDGIHDDAHLLHHVRFNNTRLRPKESFALYKHSVSKWVEPNMSWTYGGEPESYQWDKDALIAGKITDYLYELVGLLIKQRPLPEVAKSLFIPNECRMIFLSVYVQGHCIACMGLPIRESSELHQLVQQLLQDHRWCVLPNQTYDIRVSFLSEQTYLGTDESVACSKIVLGKESIMLQQDDKHALILADVIAQQAWSWKVLKQGLLLKGGIEEKQAALHWWRYRTQIWTYPYRQQAQLWADNLLTPNQCSTVEITEQVSLYLKRLQQADGSFPATYSLGEHKLYQVQDHETTALVAWVLGEEVSSSTLFFLQQQSLSYTAQAAYVQVLLKQNRLDELQPYIESWFANFESWGCWCNDDQHEYLNILSVLLVLVQQSLLTAEQVETLKYWQPYFSHFLSYQVEEVHIPLALLCAKQWEQWNNQTDPSHQQLLETLLKTQQLSGWFIPPAAHLSKVEWTARIALLLQGNMGYKAEYEQALQALAQAVVSTDVAVYMPEPTFCRGSVVSGFRQAICHTSQAALLLQAFKGVSDDSA